MRLPFCLVLYLLSLISSPAICHFQDPNISDNEAFRLREEVRSMFYHAYNSYMAHAFPDDELLPLSCQGANNFGSYSLTLIDSLDTLAIIGDLEEFGKGVEWLIENTDFDKDINASVFETNIRVLGGLLSAHLLAVELLHNYTGGLLRLAVDIGERLLPAFDTPTGLPYGTVNLKYGVPLNETTITSVAGTNTYSLEFGLLSGLTGDLKFEVAAQRASDTLWSRRSSLGLVGNHIDISTGTWTHTDATIGTAVDSYYEYLLKAGILFNDRVSLHRFDEAYGAVMRHLFRKPWYMNVDMNSGGITWPIFDALSAFWPGLQVLAGDIPQAAHTLTAFVQIWSRFGVTPEMLHLMNGQILPNRANYPLRPELVESIYYMWRVSGDPHWRHIAKQVIFSLQNITRVPCGFAGVTDIHLHKLEDQMNSFFLAETLKYLYLIFDDENFVNYATGNYLFNTEGHIIPLHWRSLVTTRTEQGTNHNTVPFNTEPREAADRNATCKLLDFFTGLAAGPFWPVSPPPEASSLALELKGQPGSVQTEMLIENPSIKNRGRSTTLRGYVVGRIRNRRERRKQLSQNNV